MFPITLAAAVDHNGIWAKIVDFLGNYDKAFPGMDGIAATARKPFYVLAFVLLVYQLVKHLSTSQGYSFGANLQPVARSVAFAVCVAFCAPMMNYVSTGFDDLGSQMGVDASPGAIIKDCEATLASYAATPTAADPAAGDSKGSWSIFKPGEAIKAGIDSAWAGIQDLLIKASQYVTIFFFKCAIFLTLVMMLMRFFIVQLASIFLPAYIAMVSIGALSGISTRYIMSIIGVLAWPLAWGLSNVGSEALLQSVGTNVIEPTADVYTYIWVGILLLFLPIWIGFTYVFGPIFIQKMVASGANAASAFVGGAAAAGVTLGAAGAGAAAAGSLAGAGKAAGAIAAATSASKTNTPASSAPAGSTGGGAAAPTSGETLAARYGSTAAPGNSGTPAASESTPAAATAAAGSSTPATDSATPASSSGGSAKPSLQNRAKAAAARAQGAIQTAGAMAATPLQMLAEAEGGAPPLPPVGSSASSTAALSSMGYRPSQPNGSAPRASAAPQQASGPAPAVPSPQTAAPRSVTPARTTTPTTTV